MTLLKNLLANKDRQYEPSNDRVCSIINGEVVEQLIPLGMQTEYKDAEGYVSVMHEENVSEEAAIEMASQYYKLPQRERATS